jgi:hypothetical protein
MAVEITHASVVTVPDNPSAVVGSGEWNDGHVVTGGAITDSIRGDGEWTPPNGPLRGIYYAIDCMTAAATAFAPWYGTAISSGTISNGTGSADHPGVLQMKSSTSADSGYYLYVSGVSMLIAGGESTDIVFRVVNSTNTTAFIGFHDGTSVTAPTDGAWLDIAGTTLTGRCKNNAGPTDTATTYTITDNVWYRGRIVVNAAGTRVDFYLYLCSTGAQVWTGYCTANIPTGAGRGTGHGVCVTNSATTAVTLIELDYMNIAIDRVFVR